MAQNNNNENKQDKRHMNWCKEKCNTEILRRKIGDDKESYLISNSEAIRRSKMQYFILHYMTIIIMSSSFLREDPTEKKSFSPSECIEWQKKIQFWRCSTIKPVNYRSSIWYRIAFVYRLSFFRNTFLYNIFPCNSSYIAVEQKKFKQQTHIQSYNNNES